MDRFLSKNSNKRVRTAEDSSSTEPLVPNSIDNEPEYETASRSEPPASELPPSGKVLGQTGSSFLEHFTLVDGKAKRYSCHYCSHVLSAPSTGNLRVHLSSRHKKHYDEYVESRKALTTKASAEKEKPSEAHVPSTTETPTVVDLMHSSRKYDKKHLKQQELTEKLCYLLATTSTPHNIVSSPAFGTFMTAAHSKYKIPHRREIGRCIDNLVDKLKRRMQQLLEGVPKLSISGDIWTQKGMTGSYLALTAHFFDLEVKKIRHMLLGFIELHDRHTAVLIKRETDKCLNSWGISESNVRAIVTDSGSNMKAAYKECVEIVKTFDDLCTTVTLSTDMPHNVPLVTTENPYIADSSIEMEAVEEEELDLEEEEEPTSNYDEEDFDQREKEFNASFYWSKRLSCIAHSIVLALKNPIESNEKLKALVDNASDVIKAFTTSHVLTRELLKVGKKQLIPSVRTRWIYLYYMLDRLLELKDAVMQVLRNSSNESVRNLGLGERDWAQLLTIRNFLQPFALHVTLLEGDNYPTLGRVIPSLLALKLHCGKYSSNSVVGSSALGVMAEFKRRFNYILDPLHVAVEHYDFEFQPLYGLSTFFEPGFRVTLKSHLPDLYTEIRKLILQTEFTDPQLDSSVSMAVDGNESASEKSSMYGDLLLTVVDSDSLPQTSPFDYLEKQLSIYESEFIKPGQIEKLDSLAWWLEKQYNYPKLFEMATDYLSIPASSASVERVFSQSGIALTKRRHRMGARTLENEIMLKVNKELIDLK